MYNVIVRIYVWIKTRSPTQPVMKVQMFWMQYLAAFPFKTPFIRSFNNLPNLFDEGLSLTLQNKLTLNLWDNVNRIYSMNNVQQK